jgi:acetylornithine deacetylase
MGKFSTLKDWIAIPSVTGAEADYADALARELGSLGLGVERQQVADGRFNLLARAGAPEVVFCTHLDTVPPWFGPSETADYVGGRGACDAKGQALAMVLAAKRLLDSGESRIGFLFTVGEETDSAGAIVANEHLAPPWRPRFTVVGEPTDNRFVAAHKGVFKAELFARGVAGHSSQNVGPSAVHELIETAQRLLHADWGRHRLLGPGTLNIGEIHGGVAANVVADRAQASLLLRAVEDGATTERKLRALLSPHVELRRPHKCYGPTEFFVPPDEEPITVAFGTDAPHLSNWGRPLLYGPGRILDAHTDHERIDKRSFERAVDELERTVRALLEVPVVQR